MITLDNIYKLRQLSSSYKGSLGLLIDLLSAGRTQNLNFFDLLARNQKKAHSEYFRLYRDEFLGFVSSFCDLLDDQFPQYSYLREIAAHIDELYVELDLELSALSPEGIDVNHFEEQYYSPIDTLFWGLIDILEILSESGDNKEAVTEKTIYLPEQLAGLRRILLPENIDLFGQKIYSDSHTLVDVEILARLRDVEGNRIMPDDFLPMVDAAGLVSDFDWMILERSFALIGKNPTNIVFSINVNPITFQKVDFIDRISLLAREYFVDPRNIVLEVLEYGKVHDVEVIDGVFGQLRKMGFRIAIDDYPSGYNTLAFVTRFKNIDIVKVDGMHVVDMYRACHSCRQISTCIQPLLRHAKSSDKWHCIKRLGEKYDLLTLTQSFHFLRLLYSDLVFFAERIENEAVYRFFMNIPGLIAGFQGYFFQKPEHILLLERFLGDDLCNALHTNKTARKIPKTSSVSGATANKSIRTIPEDTFVDHLRGLETYCYSLVELSAAAQDDDIACSSIISSDTFAHLSNIMDFLKVSALTLYFVHENKACIKRIERSGLVTLSTLFHTLSEEISMIEKQYVNFYALLHNQSTISHGGNDISHIPVQNVGDDIVVRVLPNLYIGADDMELARNFDKQIQISLFMLLAVEIKRIYQIQN